MKLSTLVSPPAGATKFLKWDPTVGGTLTDIELVPWEGIPFPIPPVQTLEGLKMTVPVTSPFGSTGGSIFTHLVPSTGKWWALVRASFTGVSEAGATAALFIEGVSGSSFVFFHHDGEYVTIQSVPGPISLTMAKTPGSWVLVEMDVSNRTCRISTDLESHEIHDAEMADSQTTFIALGIPEVDEGEIVIECSVDPDDLGDFTPAPGFLPQQGYTPVLPANLKEGDIVEVQESARYRDQAINKGELLIAVVDDEDGLILTTVEKKRFIDYNMTVRVPTDFTTVAEAYRYLTGFTFSPRVRAFIAIEGEVPLAAVKFTHTDHTPWLWIHGGGGLLGAATIDLADAQESDTVMFSFIGNCIGGIIGEFTATGWEEGMPQVQPISMYRTTVTTSIGQGTSPWFSPLRFLGFPGPCNIDVVNLPMVAVLEESRDESAIAEAPSAETVIGSFGGYASNLRSNNKNVVMIGRCELNPVPRDDEDLGDTHVTVVSSANVYIKNGAYITLSVVPSESRPRLGEGAGITSIWLQAGAWGGDVEDTLALVDGAPTINVLSTDAPVRLKLGHDNDVGVGVPAGPNTYPFIELAEGTELIVTGVPLVFKDSSTVKDRTLVKMGPSSTFRWTTSSIAALEEGDVAIDSVSETEIAMGEYSSRDQLVLAGRIKPT